MYFPGPFLCLEIVTSNNDERIADSIPRFCMFTNKTARTDEYEIELSFPF